MLEFRFEHNAEGWSAFRTKIQPYAALGVAVETSQRRSGGRTVALGLHGVSGATHGRGALPRAQSPRRSEE